MSFFIVFEGIDHVGKTTLIEKVSAKLQAKKLSVFTTQQPGGTDLGQKIRTILLDAQRLEFSSEVEFLLFLTDRYHHLEEVLLPQLQKNDLVICDRYFYSSFVYQSKFKKKESSLDQKLIFDFHQKLGLFALIPDLLFYLQLDWEKWKNHQKKTNKASDNITITEKEGQARFQRMNQGYLATFAFLGRQKTGKLVMIELFQKNLEILAEEIVAKIWQTWKKRALS